MRQRIPDGKMMTLLLLRIFGPWRTTVLESKRLIQGVKF